MNKQSKNKSSSRIAFIIIWILSLVSISLATVFIMTYKESENNDSNNTCQTNENATSNISNVAKGNKSFIDTDIYDIVDKIENKESFIVFIERESCPYCEITEPLIQDWLNNEASINIYRSSLQKFYEMKEENYTDAISEYDQIKEKLNFKYVPCVRYYHDGEYEELSTAVFDNYFDEDISEGTKIKTILIARETIYDFLSKGQAIIND